MKHFILFMHYTAPTESIDKIRPAHRVFLQKGYEAGLLLMSGPRNPRTDAFMVGRAESMEELISFFSKDPYKLNNLATYEFFEFDPVLYQPFLSQWVNPKESIRTTE